MKNRILLAVIYILSACHTKNPGEKENVPAIALATKQDSAHKKAPAFSAKRILAQKQVPILCYHRIRAWRSTDTRTMKDYIVPVENFRAEMKILADSGYHTSLPDQLYDYLSPGLALPSKPVVLTFDDSEEEHYTIASTEMKKYGFKGVFFIMTVTMDRPGYLKKEQIRALSDEGHVIASHTW